MLNLLPKEVKNRHHAASRLYRFYLLYFLVALLVGLAAAGLATYTLTSQSSLNDKQAELDKLNNPRPEISQLTLEAAFVEDRLKSAPTYQETLKWDDQFRTIAQDTPTDISLTGLKATRGEQSTLYTASGTAGDRRPIILFKEKLAAETGLNGVDIQSMTESTSNNQKLFTFTIGWSRKNDVAEK